MAELFTGLQRALGTVLAFFYEVIPSFGLSIILVTLMLNLLLFPLTLRQTRATRAFQRVQPEIKRIQTEYKDDPETMQQELARAQREAGATPAGCLFPMLIQLPIWLAIYRVFRNVAMIAQGSDVAPLIPKDSSLLAAISAGKTHFLGLSLGTTMSDGFVSGIPAALPYFLLLLCMIAAQYTQQWYSLKVSQTGGSNTGRGMAGQQVITRLMPAFIGFISFRLPAGLVLYWATSNVVRIGSQRMILRLEPPPAGQPGS